MDYVRTGTSLGAQKVKTKKLGISGIASIIFFVLVLTSTTRFIPYVQVISHIPTKILWSVGVVQNYQLFDWINRFNFKIEYDVSFRPVSSKSTVKLDHSDFLPPNVRHSLLQLRLYDIRWILKIRGEKREELREDFPRRIATKYCRKLDEDGEVRIIVDLTRVTYNNIDLKKHFAKRTITFGCRDNKVTGHTFN